ncbi:MAG: hypothetical protein GXP16_12830 [Gammaproteobacteria bacterium]|nr:hypothetical protein [Gammaproteobacteria bacterium]
MNSPAYSPRKMRGTYIVCTFAASILLLLGGCTGGKSPDRTFEIAAKGLYTGALSSDGELALIGSLHHGASLWRTQRNERLFNWSHAQGEYAQLVSAAISVDGTHAVTTDPRTLVLWNTQTGQAVNYWGTPGAVLDVAIFNDNRHVLLGLDNHSALVFDAQTGDYQQTMLHQGSVGAVALNREGTLALTGSDDNSAVLWNLNDGTALHYYQHDNPIRAVALSPSGRFAFTAALGDLVAIWDNESGQQIHQIHNGMNHGVRSARFSDDDTWLVVGYTNRQIKLISVSSGQVVDQWDPGTRHVMRPTGAAILEVAISVDNQTIWALSGDGRLLRLRTS